MMYDQAKGKCLLLWGCYQAGEAAKAAKELKAELKEASIENVTYLHALEDVVTASADKIAGAAKPPKRNGDGLAEFACSVEWQGLVKERTGDVYRELYVPWCQTSGFDPAKTVGELTKAITTLHPLKVDGAGRGARFVWDGGAK